VPSKRSHEGEILIDHRASPGLQPGQVPGVAVPGGELYESAVYACSHCQFTVVINPQRNREREWCSKCDAYICDECGYRLKMTLACDSFQRRLEQVANEVERFGSSGLLLTRL
jgi:hypothetical protein